MVLKKNEHYMKMAIKFLTDLNMLPLWIEYIDNKDENPRYYEHHFSRHWSDKLKIINVFGDTRFTAFLDEKCGIHFVDKCGYRMYVYNVFQRYLAMWRKYGYEEAKKCAVNSIVKGINA